MARPLPVTVAVGSLPGSSRAALTVMSAEAIVAARSSARPSARSASSSSTDT